jgi:hypothetical protein
VLELIKLELSPIVMFPYAQGFAYAKEIIIVELPHIGAAFLQPIAKRIVIPATQVVMSPLQLLATYKKIKRIIRKQKNQIKLEKRKTKKSIIFYRSLFSTNLFSSRSSHKSN